MPWVDGSGWPKKRCIRWGHHRKGHIFRGNGAANVTYRENAASERHALFSNEIVAYVLTSTFFSGAVDTTLLSAVFLFSELQYSIIDSECRFFHLKVN